MVWQCQLLFIFLFKIYHWNLPSDPIPLPCHPCRAHFPHSPVWWSGLSGLFVPTSFWFGFLKQFHLSWIEFFTSLIPSFVSPRIVAMPSLSCFSKWFSLGAISNLWGDAFPCFFHISVSVLRLMQLWLPCCLSFPPLFCIFISIPLAPFFWQYILQGW